MLFIIISAPHVSGGFSAHHQELIKLSAAFGYCHAFLLTTAVVDGLELYLCSSPSRRKLKILIFSLACLQK